MLDLERIRRVTDGHGLVRAVDALPTGPVRLETAFSYPEGSSIDLFVMESGTLLPELRLSDLGNTMAWLHDVQVKPWLSKKRQQFLQDALRAYGATMNGGAFELRLGGLDEIVSGVVRLAQTCLRAADLVYTRRSSLQVPANEDLEEVLADTSLPYEPNVELEGRFGVPVRVDFLVTGARNRSAVLTWSTATSGQAHVLANEIFRRWYDLDTPTRSEQRLTVFDDRYDVFRDDDLKRLQEKSTVLPLSDRGSITDFLRAA